MAYRIIGHLIIRNPNENDKIARLGFIIVYKKIMVIINYHYFFTYSYSFTAY